MIKKEKILFTLILLFFATLFFSKTTTFNVGIMAALVLYGLFFNSWTEKLQLLKQRKAIAAMLLFFVYLIVSGAMSDNFDTTLHALKIRLPLLFFPLGLGLIQLTREFKLRVVVSFATLTSLIMVACLAYSFYQYQVFHRSDLFYNDNLTLLLKQQSIYVALLVNLSIYIFGYCILFTNRPGKIFMGMAVLFLLGISYLLASRINLAMLGAISLAGCGYYIFSRKKLMEGIALLFGLLLIAFWVYKFQPKSLNRFKELAFTEFNYGNQAKDSHFNVALAADQWNGANFRLAAWNCGWEVFKENAISGTGLGDKDDALRAKYQEKNFKFALQHDRNVHNNYLDILFSLGLVGFALFLMGWVVLPLSKTFRTGDFLAFAIILTIAVAWITEVYFSRNFGTMIVSFFIPFLLTNKKENPAEMNQRDF